VDKDAGFFVSRHHQETLWRATDLRLLYSWFAVTSEGGRFRWKHWCAQLDHSGRLPLEFVSRAWLLGLALGTGADMAHVAKHGLDAAFKPLQVRGTIARVACCDALLGKGRG
jgi:hypothetical protein